MEPLENTSFSSALLCQIIKTVCNFSVSKPHFNNWEKWWVPTLRNFYTSAIDIFSNVLNFLILFSDCKDEMIVIQLTDYLFWFFLNRFTILVQNSTNMYWTFSSKFILSYAYLSFSQKNWLRCCVSEKIYSCMHMYSNMTTHEVLSFSFIFFHFLSKANFVPKHPKLPELRL